MNDKILSEISQKIVKHNLNKYEKREIVTRLLKKKKNYRLYELDQKVIEKKTKDRILILSEIHNKDIKWVKIALLKCKELSSKIEMIINIKKRNSGNFLISNVNPNNNDIREIEIEKGTGSNYYFFKMIMELNLKIKDRKRCLKNLLKELKLLIYSLNQHYKSKYKIFKEKKNIEREKMKDCIKKLKINFFQSDYFIGEVDNYIINNNSNKILYDKDSIMKLNLKYWNTIGKSKYKNMDEYLFFLKGLWFK